MSWRQLAVLAFRDGAPGADTYEHEQFKTGAKTSGAAGLPRIMATGPGVSYLKLPCPRCSSDS